MNFTPISRKLVERSISKSAKQAIATGGINTSTRGGSKELEHLVKRLANQPFSSLAAATKLGEELGQQIVALSQQMGRQNLDQGVIRQLMLRKQLPVVDVSLQDAKVPQTQSTKPATVPNQVQPAKPEPAQSAASTKQAVPTQTSVENEPTVVEEPVPTVVIPATEQPAESTALDVAKTEPVATETRTDGLTPVDLPESASAVEEETEELAESVDDSLETDTETEDPDEEPDENGIAVSQEPTAIEEIEDEANDESDEAVSELGDSSLDEEESDEADDNDEAVSELESDSLDEADNESDETDESVSELEDEPSDEVADEAEEIELATAEANTVQANTDTPAEDLADIAADEDEVEPAEPEAETAETVKPSEREALAATET